nr:autotransporter-associated beta strand repeat-containing protein [Candidatus Paceibacterota bacterium]
LTKTGAGTLTITGVTTIGGDLTISNGTFVAPTSLTINGDFSNSGTYTHSNGTVTVVPTNSTGVFEFLGSSDTTFYNLTNITAGSTLQFKAGNTYTFANTLTITGSEANPISINSDTPDSQWLMTLSGSASISYLKVKDSGCSGGNTVGASSTIYNYGNNGVCWSFITISGGGGGGGVEVSDTPDEDQGGGGGGGEGGGGATTAIATAVVSANVVQSVTINAGGSGYTSVPSVLFCGGGGSGALGTAVLTDGAVSSVTVDAGGSNYTTVPSIVFNSSCPTEGGGGGGGGGGDIGFLFPRKTMFAFVESVDLDTLKKYLSMLFA